MAKVKGMVVALVLVTAKNIKNILIWLVTLSNIVWNKKAAHYVAAFLFF